MAVRKRLRRNDPARTAPLRDFANLYSRGNHSKPDGAPGSAPPRAARPGATPKGPLAEGVELAYRVIEKHIVDGRRAAEQFNKQSYATRAGADSMNELLERMVRFQSEILPLWVEALGTLVKVDPSTAGRSTARDAAMGSNGASAPGAVSIALKSRRPVEVSLDLRGHKPSQRLITLGLRSVDSRKAPLTDIKFQPNPAGGCSTLSIRIPDRQPPGTYSGIIVDRDTGDPRGTLSVRVVQ